MCDSVIVENEYHFVLHCSPYKIVKDPFLHLIRLIPQNNQTQNYGLFLPSFLRRRGMDDNKQQPTAQMTFMAKVFCSSKIWSTKIHQINKIFNPLITRNKRKYFILC